MESKPISTVQALESKLLIKKLLTTRPDNNYENLVSVYMNLHLLEIENVDANPKTKACQLCKSH